MGARGEYRGDCVNAPSNHRLELTGARQRKLIAPAAQPGVRRPDVRSRRPRDSWLSRKYKEGLMNCISEKFLSELKSLVSIVLIVSIMSGCATSTVLSRPPAKDLNVLNPGTSRGTVHSELGAPSYSKDISGEKLDTFAFDKGVSGGYKFGRGFFHIAADLFTIFLWELVAWPAEKIAARPNTTVEVGYDKDEKVKTINYVKR